MGLKTGRQCTPEGHTLSTIHPYSAFAASHPWDSRARPGMQGGTRTFGQRGIRTLFEASTIERLANGSLPSYHLCFLVEALLVFRLRLRFLQSFHNKSVAKTMGLEGRIRIWLVLHI